MTQLVVLSTLLVLLSSGNTDAADLREGVEQLAAAIANGMPENRQVRVAVTDFPDLQGVTSDLGRYVAERLTTRLAQSPRFRVIERRRLGQVLGELKFGISDLVDPQKAKQLGRIAGVEGLVVGSLSDLGNTIEIDTRLIEIESGNMLVATTTSVSKDETVRGMYERGREVPTSANVMVSPRGALSVPASAIASQEFAKFRVELGGIVASRNGRVTLVLRYFNKTRGPLRLGLIGASSADAGYWDRTETILYDDAGNKYVFCGGPGMTTMHRKLEEWFTVEVGLPAEATFVFAANRGLMSCLEEARDLKFGKSFSLSSGQKVGDESGLTTHTISLRNLVPR